MQKAGALLHALFSKDFLLEYTITGQRSGSRVVWRISHDKGAESLEEGEMLLKKMGVSSEELERRKYTRMYM